MFPSRFAKTKTRAFARQAANLLALGDKARTHILSNKPLFENLGRKFYAQLWNDTARDLELGIEALGDDYFRIAAGPSHTTIVRRGFVMLDSRLSLDLAGHKPLTLRLIHEAGAPRIRHLEFDLAELSKARSFLDKLGAPGVVKPAIAGSAGAAVTTGIVTPRDLRNAALHAASKGNRILLEEQIEGDSWRLLYLDGELIDAVCRKPCVVTGDGRTALKELIGAENKARLAADPAVALHPLTVDREMKQCLKLRGLGLRHVPKEGEPIQLKRVVNQNSRHQNESRRDQVHPHTVSLGAQVASALGIRLAGVDVLTTNIGMPLHETGGVINEVNTTPGLHHHYLIDNPDQGVPVARILIARLLGID